MKFVALDVETTGLIPDLHQILEIGIVLADFSTPIEQLPRIRRVIQHQQIIGHPFALMMNAALITEIATAKGGEVVASTTQAYRDIKLWLNQQGMPIGKDGKIHFTAAGKNVAGFDIPFLRHNGPWDSEFQVAHRCFDPGPLYYQHGDEKLPDLQLCMDRAGITRTVTHTAVDDALNVVRVLRAKYGEE